MEEQVSHAASQQHIEDVRFRRFLGGKCWCVYVSGQKLLICGAMHSPDRTDSAGMFAPTRLA